MAVDADHFHRAHSSTHRAQPAKHVRFWQPARPHLRWGEPQHDMHASWGDLFYDLIMVGAAFRCGAFFSKAILDETGPLVLIGTGLTVLSSWSHLLQYRARFDAKSGAHKIVDTLEGLSAAAAAHSIVADKQAFEAHYMYAFLWMVLLNRAVQFGRRLELALQPVPASGDRSARAAALDNLARIFVEGCVLAAGFAVETVSSMMGILILAWIVQVLLVLVPALLGLYSRRNMVPVHVAFSVRRMGEMVMLNFGEGVLSLILSETDNHSPKWRECDARCWRGKAKSAVSFISSYVTLIALMWCYYRANVFSAREHVVRRSPIGGIAWTLSHWPLCIGLIGAGVSIKTIHPHSTEATVNRAYVRAHAICVSFVLVTVAFQQLLHAGVGAYWRAPRWRKTRLGLLATKLALALLAFIEMGFPAGTEGWVYMLTECLLCLSCALCTALEKSPQVERGLWHHVHRLSAAEGGKPPADDAGAHAVSRSLTSVRSEALVRAESEEPHAAQHAAGDPAAALAVGAEAVARAQSGLGASEVGPSLSRRGTAAKHDNSEALDSLPPLAHDHHDDESDARARAASRGERDVEAGGADAGAGVRNGADDEVRADEALRLETRAPIFRPRALIRTASSMLGFIEPVDLDDGGSGSEEEEEEGEASSSASRGAHLTEDINSAIVLCG